MQKSFKLLIHHIKNKICIVIIKMNIKQNKKKKIVSKQIYTKVWKYKIINKNKLKNHYYNKKIYQIIYKFLNKNKLYFVQIKRECNFQNLIIYK